MNPCALAIAVSWLGAYYNLIGLHLGYIAHYTALTTKECNVVSAVLFYVCSVTHKVSVCSPQLGP